MFHSQAGAGAGGLTGGEEGGPLYPLRLQNPLGTDRDLGRNTGSQRIWNSQTVSFPGAGQAERSVGRAPLSPHPWALTDLWWPGGQCQT